MVYRLTTQPQITHTFGDLKELCSDRPASPLVGLLDFRGGVEGNASAGRGATGRKAVTQVWRWTFNATSVVKPVSSPAREILFGLLPACLSVPVFSTKQRERWWMAHRAHELICKVGADSKECLADELRSMADQIERDELTVGCSGGACAGALYSYKHDPDMTHDLYFQGIEAELAKDRAARLTEQSSPRSKTVA